MSKEVEESYKKYLDNNFDVVLNYLDKTDENNEEWCEELISYNNIMGSLIGLIDSKGTGKDFQNCKDFVLRYYEQTYPKKQLSQIDEALFSNKCYEYIEYASKNLVTDNRDLEIIKAFSKAYLKGYNLEKNVTLRFALPYYFKKINEYSNKLKDKENEKTI